METAKDIKDFYKAVTGIACGICFLLYYLTVKFPVIQRNDGGDGSPLTMVVFAILIFVFAFNYIRELSAAKEDPYRDARIIGLFMLPTFFISSLLAPYTSFILDYHQPELKKGIVREMRIVRLPFDNNFSLNQYQLKLQYRSDYYKSETPNAYIINISFNQFKAIKSGDIIEYQAGKGLLGYNWISIISTK